MAKVKGPLFSLSASGKIADSLVFFPWKGVNSVRTWVIPSNPRTSRQIGIRTIFTAAVAEWHAARYNALDREAWRRAASVQPRIMTGFNLMVRTYITIVHRLGFLWQRLHHGVLSAITTSGFTFNVKAAPSMIVSPVLFWGLTPQTLLTQVDMTGVGVSPFSEWQAVVSGLTPKTRYFFQLRAGDSTSRGQSGIYSVDTL